MLQIEKWFEELHLDKTMCANSGMNIINEFMINKKSPVQLVHELDEYVKNNSDFRKFIILFSVLFHKQGLESIEGLSECLTEIQKALEEPKNV